MENVAFRRACAAASRASAPLPLLDDRSVMLLADRLDTYTENKEAFVEKAPRPASTRHDFTVTNNKYKRKHKYK